MNMYSNVLCGRTLFVNLIWVFLPSYIQGSTNLILPVGAGRGNAPSLLSGAPWARYRWTNTTWWAYWLLHFLVWSLTHQRQLLTHIMHDTHIKHSSMHGHAHNRSKSSTLYLPPHPYPRRASPGKSARWGAQALKHNTCMRSSQFSPNLHQDLPDWII